MGVTRKVAELCGHSDEPDSVQFIEPVGDNPAFTGAVRRSTVAPSPRSRPNSRKSPRKNLIRPKQVTSLKLHKILRRIHPKNLPKTRILPKRMRPRTSRRPKHLPTMLHPLPGILERLQMRRPHLQSRRPRNLMSSTQSSRTSKSRFSKSWAISLPTKCPMKTIPVLENSRLWMRL